jgi:hypothetical protein
MEGIESFLRSIEKHRGIVVRVSEQSILAAEAELSRAVPPAYRSFLLKVGEVETRYVCFAKVSSPSHEWYLPRMCATAQRYGLPSELEPFCEENNDFHCLTSSQEVVFWSHHHFIVNRWPSFGEWLTSLGHEA